MPHCFRLLFCLVLVRMPWCHEPSDELVHYTASCYQVSRTLHAAFNSMEQPKLFHTSMEGNTSDIQTSCNKQMYV